jgi:GntR family transcriptional regulator, rspAB operon transcriptional repressor
MTSDPTSAQAPAEESKSRRVYNYLRRRIRDLEIPPGTALRKNDIALECGVSRAPVSEAIARLSAEGLVDVFPQSGSFVSPIRVEDVRESMFIRMALEVEAVRRVARLADPELLQRLEANIQAQQKALQQDRLDASLYDDLDEAMHAEIMAALHSSRAQHQLGAARVLLDRPRFLALEGEHRPEDTLAEHRRIVEAIGTGDPDLAAAAMRLHLANVAAAMEARLAQMEEDPDGGKP